MSRDKPEENADDMPDMLAADDAAEEVSGSDAGMDSDADADDAQEVELQNDCIAYFDMAQDSLFAIAQHPSDPQTIAVGGSAGSSDEAPGAGWILHIPPLPSSSPSSSPQSLEPSATIHGHDDSITALAWTMPRGEALASGGMDGRLRIWAQDKLVGEAHEVDEVTWLAACPAAAHANVMALGASDGSVWIYAIDVAASPALSIIASYFVHSASCTAGAWSADGTFLITVAEDASLLVWDPWHAAAAHADSVFSLDAHDSRFATQGLYSLAIDPRGAFIATGGAAGAIRIVSLPRLHDSYPGGTLLAALHTLSETVESLSISALPATTLLAAASVDGSIAVYDASRNFAVRAAFPSAHAPHAVVKVDFVPRDWLLTSCGMDGVVRRWDLRAATAPGAGLVHEWRGHRGGGEGGGVLGFVQGHDGSLVVTAGDDGLALVFKA
ncbi:hypothetical protein CDD81_848 [Ophiocordyceps australis]|uniref:Uncharacterized protein n=1 Tax=Ophiocordyceps australis TaxID=1399860 RepID=A0A2C5Y028_9HYPO|nr:hypothetical protein CDD81_848 [Ophiocordyceps australis]